MLRFGHYRIKKHLAIKRAYNTDIVSKLELVESVQTKPLTRTNQIWQYTIITLIPKNYFCRGLKLLQKLRVQSVTIGVIDIRLGRKFLTEFPILLWVDWWSEYTVISLGVVHIYIDNLVFGFVLARNSNVGVGL